MIVLALACAEPEDVPRPEETVEARCTLSDEAVEPLPLTTCDGASTTPQDLCGEPALILNLYGWCAPCFREIDHAEELVDEFLLRPWVVVTEDPLSGTPDSAYCDALAAEHPAVEVRLDPSRSLESTYGGPGLVLVLDSSAEVVFAREGAPEDVIRDAVEGVQP